MDARQKLRKFARDYSLANNMYQHYTDDYCQVEVSNENTEYFFVGYYGDYSVSEFGYAYCACVPKNFFSYRELKALEREYGVKLL